MINGYIFHSINLVSLSVSSTLYTFLKYSLTSFSDFNLSNKFINFYKSSYVSVLSATNILTGIAIYILCILIQLSPVVQKLNGLESI